MRPHETHPDWLVDDRGHLWRRERYFTCPNHPYGPDRQEGDESTACELLVRLLLDELQPEAICTVAPGATRELVEQAHVELSLCCLGHRWRNTGKLLEVGPLEVFIHENMPRMAREFAESISGSIFLKELEGSPLHPDPGKRVVIPLIRTIGDTSTDG